MGFSERIISNLSSYQPQRPSHFDVTIGIPVAGGGCQVIPFRPESISYGLVQSFETPTREFEVKEFSYYGIKRKIPIRRKYGSFSLSFLLDDYMAIAGWFEYWMDIIINPFSDYIENYNPEISSGFVELKPVDQNFSYAGSYRFLEAYPAQILPMQFDTSIKSSTMKYTILFNCTEYQFIGSNYESSSKSP